MTTPDCPHCDANDTLKVVRAESRGVRVCECSCCSAVVRVNADGAVVHVVRTADVVDVSGNLIDGP